MAKKKKEIDLLLENFVLLQKTLADIGVSLKELQKKFSEFLEVIEKAAEEKIEKKEEKIEEKEKKPKDLAEKIDLLIEQNKAMAEGIILLEKFLKEKLEELERR
jgi:uncharacterized membrane protein (DUF106 family)